MSRAIKLLYCGKSSPDSPINITDTPENRQSLAQIGEDFEQLSPFLLKLTKCLTYIFISAIIRMLIVILIVPIILYLYFGSMVLPTIPTFQYTMRVYYLLSTF